MNEHQTVSFIDANFFFQNPSLLIIIEEGFVNLDGLSEHVFTFDEVIKYQIGVVKGLLVNFRLLFIVDELHSQHNVGIQEFLVHDFINCKLLYFPL